MNKSYAGNPITITLSASSYKTPKSLHQIGEKIKFAKSNWWVSNQRIKNKMMVHRLLRKEYYPYLITTNVENSEGSTTLTVKPYNF